MAKKLNVINSLANKYFVDSVNPNYIDLININKIRKDQIKI